MSTPTIEIPEFPQSFTTSSDPMVLALRGALENQRATLVKLSGTYAEIRSADDTAKAALDTSDHEAAVQYRAAKEKFDAQMAAVKAERDAKLEEIRKEYKARIDDGEKKLREITVKTLAAVKGEEVLADVNLDDVVTEYDNAVNATRLMANAIKNNNDDIVNWAKSIPGATRQARGNNGKGASGPRGWTPRFHEIAISSTDENGETTQVFSGSAGAEKVDERATFTAAAKAIGVSGKAGRELFTKRYEGAIGHKDNHTEGHEASFTVENNGKTFTVNVVAHVKSSDAADSSAEDDSESTDSE